MNVLTEIEIAYERISRSVNLTPLEYSNSLSHTSGANVYFKCEHLQHTGSFKFRGALNKILSLTPEQKQQGILAASTGNHGLGVAQAAKLANIDATIFLPENTPLIKRDAISFRGAKIRLIDGDCSIAEIAAREVADSQKKSFISPYNDMQVMAGQGTIGLELLKQTKDIDAIFISVGGGGLISGIGSYLKTNSPNTKIIGCWPKNAPAMYECLQAGQIIEVIESNTLSQATAGNVELGSITFEYCQKVIDEKILVTEQEIAEAMHLVAENEHYIVEGAAGVALAAFLKQKDQYVGKKVVILLCGRNIPLPQFISVI